MAARIDGHDVAVASFKDAIRAGKDAAAAKDPDGYGRIRAIEIAAKQEALADGKTSAPEEFAIRNRMRAAQGLGAEKRKRGGLAGAYDKGFLAPALAIGLGPLALGLAGGGAAGGAGAAGTAGTAGTVGTAATAASGGLAPIVAGGPVGAGGFSLGGLASQAGNFLKDPKNLLKLGSGIYGITQQQKGAGQMNQALADDRARWAAGAPLREQGRAQMLAPMPVDTSSLDALAGQGNPFAKKQPPVAVPPIPLGGR